VTVADRRVAVPFLVARGVAERRACSFVHLHRATLQYQARPDRKTDLEQRLQELFVIG
jgi:hypothetical protein